MTDALTVFELLSGGHYPNFLRLVIEAWRDRGSGCLRAIVSNRFLERHRYVFEGFENVPGSSVRWETLDNADESVLEAVQAVIERRETDLGPVVDPQSKNLLTLHWSFVEKYARQFPARHILLMRLDEHLLSLASGRLAPSDFSGILFLPSYYYRRETGDMPLRHRLFQTFHERMVNRLLNHPQLRVAFFIDPWVSESLQGKSTAQIVYLVDPVKLPEHHSTPAEKAAIRAQLGVPSNRKLFLLFGAIAPRKGMWRLIDALRKLTPEENARMCLAIVGDAEDPAMERQLAIDLKTLTARTQLAVIRRAGYVDDGEMTNWFTVSDVVLLPYLNHVGMSGVQLIAAAHRRPVLSQTFGPMGRLTREHQLGLTIEPRDPLALAGAIRRFLDERTPPGFDPAVAYALAKQQSHEKFAETLLGTLRPYTT